MKDKILEIARELKKDHITPEIAKTKLLDLFGVIIPLPELCSSCFRRNTKNQEYCKCGKRFKRQ